MPRNVGVSTNKLRYKRMTETGFCGSVVWDDVRVESSCAIACDARSFLAGQERSISLGMRTL